MSASDSGKDVYDKIIKGLLLTLPWLVSVLYAFGIYGYFTTYLDIRLHYVPPSTPSAPEDVLGLGFFFTWIMVLFIWAMVEIPACYVAKRKLCQFICAASVFFAISVIDLYYYTILASQVST